MLFRSAGKNQNKKFLTQELSKNGGRVFQCGDSLVMSLPSEDIFRGDSANFADSAHPLLDEVYGMIGYYHVPLVSVTGYFKPTGDYGFSKALSMERARRVVRYLWKSGVDSNFMYADAQEAALNGKPPYVADRVLIVVRNHDPKSGC